MGLPIRDDFGPGVLAAPLGSSGAATCPQLPYSENGLRCRPIN
jgi:hypothetical protein